MDDYEYMRLNAKTGQQRFVQMLRCDFKLPPRVAEVIVQEAEAFMSGRQQALKPGQVRVILAERHAKAAQTVAETEMVEVTWTVDAGAEDLEVRQRFGRQALRRVRIQRLLAEALEQNAIASQEDLARALQVTVRTIKRDFAHLQAQGVYLPSRGYLHGIGRGQTHKAQIVRCWLEGQTYDQISYHTHHCLTSIQRYLLFFVQVVQLHQQQFTPVQISQIVQLGLPLVREYLALYENHNSPDARMRLQEQLERLTRYEKKGGP